MMGDQCKLFINSGSFATPTWTDGEIKKAKNVKSPRKRSSAAKSGRGDGFVTYDISDLIDAPITFTLVLKRGDTLQDDLRDAFNNNTSILIAALDGDPATSGSEGVHGLYGIEDYSRDEPDDGTVVYEVSMLPVDEDQIEWMDIA